MNFLTKQVPWANWQFSLLKLSMLAFGIIVGAAFAEFWKPYLWLLAFVFVVTAAWATALWLRAMRKVP